MWVRPATPNERSFVRHCARDCRDYASGAFSGEHVEKVLQRLGPDQRKVYVAFVWNSQREPEPVGITIKGAGNDLAWAMAPEHRRKGLAFKMVRLVADAGYLARIDASDIASTKIAQRVGFDLIEDGPIQLWRADRVPPYA
jgi:hypothetical protein